MAISLKHAFTSPKADGVDSTLVQPSNWNAEHTITLAAGKVLGRNTSGAGAAQELPLAFDTAGNAALSATGYFTTAVGTTAERPGTPVTGMFRFNSSLTKFEGYNGTAWSPVGGGGATISDTAPASPSAGDLWWNSANGQMYTYYNDGTSSQWVVANSFTGGSAYLPLTGGTVTGPTTFSSGATVASLNGGPLAGMRNRIINGDMRIDQRNVGASVTPTAAVYTLDRWTTNLTQASKFSVQQNAGSVTPPSGYTNYLGVTSLSSYSVSSGDFFALLQNIEGFNVADFGFGAAGASTVTLSFWVRSSLTGTFGGSLTNSAINRSYPFSYSISAANTWEQKSVTISGDTSGTWLKDNGVGLRVYFNLGAGSTYSGTAGAWAGATYLSATGATSVVGTNGATFYITGVQLEVGNTATPYEREIFSTTLQKCQRYYLLFGGAVNNFGVQGYSAAGNNCSFYFHWPVPMRATPTVTLPTMSNSNTSGLVANNPNQYGVLMAATASGTGAISSLNTGGGSGSASAEL